MNHIGLNWAIYDRLVVDAMDSSRQSTEHGIRRLAAAAAFAVHAYPGILSDYRIETSLNSAGQACGIRKVSRRQSNPERRVLHIASELYNTGGHTRVIRNWMLLDRQSESYVALTRQRAVLSLKMRTSLKAVCKQMYQLAYSNELSAARELRELIAGIHPDYIVLHHHPDDVIPVIALSEPGGPPVLLYNHADHLFGLGSSVADVYIEFREVAIKCSLSQRLARCCRLLPFPLEPAEGVDDHTDCRTVEVTPDQFVLVAVASQYKFVPFQEFDFFSFYRRFLAHRPNVHLFVVGVSANDFPVVGREPLPANIHCLGEVESIGVLARRADYFVEPFPMGAGLGLYDVVRHGAFPIFNFGGIEIHRLCGKSTFPSELVAYAPTSLCDYEAFLIDELDRRRHSTVHGPVLSAYLENCVGTKWQEQLEEVYSFASTIAHSVGMPERHVRLDGFFAERWAEFAAMRNNPVTVLQGIEQMIASEESARRVREVTDAYENSWSFRLGRKLVWLPGRIGKAIRSIRSTFGRQSSIL